jgi:RNA polymerase sigma-70 factor (ECF subfamily)
MELLEQQTELLERFAHGELEAFEKLFRQYQGEVYGWMVRMVRDPGVAEDLTVETFWRIYRARARFDPRRNFGAWARRIATNAALDSLKGGYVKNARRETELLEDSVLVAVADPGVQRDLRERTERAFQRLPAKLRLVANLALVEERPYKEIAEGLGISSGAVKLRVFRALRLLRKSLKQMGVEP